MVMLGAANSRMKDFFDVATIAGRMTLDGATLSRAIAATFARRQTALPREPPLALRSEFAADAGKQHQWSAFIARSRLPDTDVAGAIEVLYTLLWPATQVAASGVNATAQWIPERLMWV